MTSMWLIQSACTASQNVVAGSQGTRLRFAAMVRSSALRCGSGSLCARVSHNVLYFEARSRAMVDAVIMALSWVPFGPDCSFLSSVL